MKRLALILFLLPPVLGGAAAFAQETNSADGPDLKSFDIVVQNNIFDQSRTGLRGFSRPRPRAPRVERLTLLGIAGDGGRGDIIFGGNGASSRPVSVGDHIAGFFIKAATLDTVELTNSSNTFVLRVPSSLRRVDDGPWEKSAEETDSEAVTSSGGDAASATAQSDSSSAAHPSESAIERRLRLRREQEEK